MVLSGPLETFLAWAQQVAEGAGWIRGENQGECWKASMGVSAPD